MLNIHLVVTPFLLVLCLTAALVAERWLRQQNARVARIAVIGLASLVTLWGVLVIVDGAYTTYMATPPDLPTHAAH